MQFKDLQYFQKLAELSSYTATASAFQVTQPTISYAIKRLEEYFGCVLIIKDPSRRKITLTPAGQALLEELKNISQAIDQTKQRVAQVATQSLTIGVPPIISAVIMPKLLKKLTKEKLKLRLHTVRGGSVTIRHTLREGSVDISLIGSLRKLVDSDFMIKELWQESFYFVMSKDHPLAHFKGLTFQEVSQEKFILLDEHNMHLEVFQDLSKRNQVSPDILFKVDDIQLVTKLLSEELGISLLAKSALSKNHMEGLVRVPLLDQEAPCFHVSVAYPKGHYQETLLEKIFEILNEMSYTE